MQKTEIEILFEKFQQLTILVIGDVMLDSYIWGNVERISPEAPVPIVNVKKREHRLGGAANVARNVSALGGIPILAATIGKDKEASIFTELMEEELLPTKGILNCERPTTVKTRVIGNNHQLLRVDAEDSSLLDEETAAAFEKHVIKLINGTSIDAVIFEDYDKGLINEHLIREVVALAKLKNIPVAVDPKKRNFNFYKNVTLFKPNLKEMREGLKIEIPGNNIAAIILADEMLRQHLQHEISLITLSENGVFVGETEANMHIPAHVRSITDVSGAGDTVIATATLCLAAETSISFMAQLANLAGGIVCEKVGVVPIDAKVLKSEAIKLLAIN
jgi:D-glycero-beta-D-manno-heptose-7-phosphate kinase